MRKLVTKNQIEQIINFILVFTCIPLFWFCLDLFLTRGDISITIVQYNYFLIGWILSYIFLATILKFFKQGTWTIFAVFSIFVFIHMAGSNFQRITTTFLIDDSDEYQSVRYILERPVKRHPTRSNPPGPYMYYRNERLIIKNYNEIPESYRVGDTVCFDYYTSKAKVANNLRKC